MGMTEQAETIGDYLILPTEFDDGIVHRSGQKNAIFYAANLSACRQLITDIVEFGADHLRNTLSNESDLYKLWDEMSRLGFFYEPGNLGQDRVFLHADTLEAADQAAADADQLSRGLREECIELLVGTYSGDGTKQIVNRYRELLSARGLDCAKFPITIVVHGKVDSESCDALFEVLDTTKAGLCVLQEVSAYLDSNYDSLAAFCDAGFMPKLELLHRNRDLTIDDLAGSVASKLVDLLSRNLNLEIGLRYSECNFSCRDRVERLLNYSLLLSKLLSESGHDISGISCVMRSSRRLLVNRNADNFYDVNHSGSGVQCNHYYDGYKVYCGPAVGDLLEWIMGKSAVNHSVENSAFGEHPMLARASQSDVYEANLLTSMREGFRTIREYWLSKLFEEMILSGRETIQLAAPLRFEIDENKVAHYSPLYS
ncbi:MAG: hypothetical protein AAGF84_01230 [Planctomycetota bacterium]